MRSVSVLFALAAAGLVWLEFEMTATLDAQQVSVAQQPESVEPDGEVPLEVDQEGAAPQSDTVVDELSPEEIEAELRRAQQALDDPDAPEEFVQAKPLPADIAIDLPSDI